MKNENENKPEPTPISMNDWMLSKVEKTPEQVIFEFFFLVRSEGKVMQLTLNPLQHIIFTALINSLRNKEGGFNLQVVRQLPPDLLK